MVAVCVTFFLLTVPLTLYYVLAFNLGEYVYQGPEMALIETFILILGLSNHAINFFLYVVTSEKFCTELANIMPGCLGLKKKRKADKYRTSSFKGQHPSQSQVSSSSAQSETMVSQIKA